MSQELPPSERPPAPPRPSWEDEKEREKEREKNQEKEREKDAEKIRRDPLSAIVWASILILAGLIFLVDNLGYLPKIGQAEVWHWIAFGAGLIVLLETFVRIVSPDYARPVTGRFILAGVLIAVGLSGLVNPALAWPLILVLVGVALLANALLRRR